MDDTTIFGGSTRRVEARSRPGLSRRATARQFEVSVSFVVKLMQRWRRGGTVAPEWSAAGSARRSAAHAERVTTCWRPSLTSRSPSCSAGWPPRAIDVSQAAISRFLTAEACRKKKDAARRRAGAAGRRRGAGRLARPAAGAEPGAPGLHRRNLGDDQHDAALWPRAARAAAGRRRAARPLEDHDLPRRAAPRRPDRTLRLRRRDQRRTLPRLGRAGAGADASPGDIVVMDNLAPTRSKVSARPSRRAAPGCSICRPTRPT